jgi:hypothetical protein
MACADGIRLYYSLDEAGGIQQIALSGGVSEPIPVELQNAVLLPGYPRRMGTECLPGRLVYGTRSRPNRYR